MRGSFTFKIASATGVRWMVTSKEIPSLLAEGENVPAALEAAATAIRDMAFNAAIDGQDATSLFKPSP